MSLKKHCQALVSFVNESKDSSSVTVLADEFHEIIHKMYHTMPGTWKMLNKCQLLKTILNR